MEHVNLEQILSYLEDQTLAQEQEEVEEHLTTCQRCYSAYLGLKAIAKNLGQSFEEKEEASSSCPDDWEIANLIMEESPTEISEKISRHIKECAFCLGQAARYYKSLGLKEKDDLLKTPPLWKEKAIGALKSKSNSQEKKASIFQQILTFFQKISALLPPLPGYALAGLVIAIAILIWINLPYRDKIITIASSERIIIRSSDIPSALGFMGTGEKTENREKRADQTMKIRLKDNKVIFTWKSIENALTYAFSLMEKPKGDIIFSQADLKKPQAFIRAKIIDKHKLYSWIIKGETPDGRYFEYHGDFILVR